MSYKKLTKKEAMDIIETTALMHSYMLRLSRLLCAVPKTKATKLRAELEKAKLIRFSMEDLLAGNVVELAAGLEDWPQVLSDSIAATRESILDAPSRYGAG